MKMMLANAKIYHYKDEECSKEKRRRYIFFGFWNNCRRCLCCARLRLGVGGAINVLYLGHTLLAQILRPLVFLRISLLPHQLLPPFCAFYSTFAPAFSRTHFCGAAQEYKWSEMKKRERQREEIDSEVRGLLTFNLQQKRVVVGNDVERSGRRRSVKSVGIKRTKWPQFFLKSSVNLMKMKPEHVIFSPTNKNGPPLAEKSGLKVYV